MTESRVDDSKSEVDEKVGADPNQNNEEEDHINAEGSHKIEHDLGPTLKSYALEYHQKRIEDVVEIDDSKVGICYCFTADVCTETIVISTEHTILQNFRKKFVDSLKKI